MNVNYIVDEKGKHSAVIVPIDEWDELISKFEKLNRKVKVLSGLEKAVDEVSLIRAGKKEGKLFKTFLDEN
jgi:tetrahydromethanopterin S-methyltransferase subunit G